MPTPSTSTKPSSPIRCVECLAFASPVKNRYPGLKCAAKLASVVFRMNQLGASAPRLAFTNSGEKTASARPRWFRSPLAVNRRRGRDTTLALTTKPSTDCARRRLPASSIANSAAKTSGAWIRIGG